MNAKIVSQWDLCLLLSLLKEKKECLNSLKLQYNEVSKESGHKNANERSKEVILNYVPVSSEVQYN